MFNKQVKEYFIFSHREKKGIRVLFILILLVSLLNLLLPCLMEPQPYDNSEFREKAERFMQSLEQKDSIRQYQDNIFSDKQIIQESYMFDPNTVRYEELLELGFSSFAASNMIKYRNSGGIFHRKEDVKKIYGIDMDTYRRLESRINIDVSPRSDSSARSGSFNIGSYGISHSPVELNRADTNELMQLYGIGTVLASRIVKYRNLLGGFFCTGQLKEVYGIDEKLYVSLKNRIVVDTVFIEKININKSGYNDLIRHPYLTSYQVKGIEKYLDFSEGLKEISDLKKFSLLPDSVYQRIKHYLEI